MSRLPKGMRKSARGGYESRFTFEGKRYSVYGRTVCECSERELARRKQIEKGVYKTSRGLTFAHYYKVWENMRLGTVSESTVRTNRYVYKLVSEISMESEAVRFGLLNLKKIEQQHLKRVQLVLHEEYSVATVNKCMSLIRAILDAAQEAGIIPNNPARSLRDLKETKRPARETIHRALSREETEAFLRAAKDCGSWYRPLYIFLLNTGCRFGEAGALMEKDIRDGGVWIERTLTKTIDGRLTVGRDAKTSHSTRMIPKRQETLDAIQEQRIQNARAFGADDGPIFRAPRGGLLGARCVATDINELCSAAGIERFAAHAFRDTFATRAIESGMQPKTLQEILGHSDIGVTMNLYVHVMEDTKRTQMNAVKV